MKDEGEERSVRSVRSARSVSWGRSVRSVSWGRSGRREMKKKENRDRQIMLDGSGEWL